MFRSLSQLYVSVIRHGSTYNTSVFRPDPEYGSNLPLGEVLTQAGNLMTHQAVDVPSTV